MRYLSRYVDLLLIEQEKKTYFAKTTTVSSKKVLYALCLNIPLKIATRTNTEESIDTPTSNLRKYLFTIICCLDFALLDLCLQLCTKKPVLTARSH
jgi:hypothetical protein